MRSWWILKGLKIVLFVGLAVFLFGYIVMSLWNMVVNPIFGLPLLSFWQAIGLLILAKLLFGGFRPGWGGGCHWGHKSHWKHHWKKRWDNMSEEDRVKFKERWGKRCGWYEDMEETQADDQKESKEPPEIEGQQQTPTA